MLNDAVGFEKIFIATGYTDLRRIVAQLSRQKSKIFIMN